MATSSEPRPFRESTTEEVGLSTKRQLLKWKRMFADGTGESWVADEHHASFGVHTVFCWVCRNAGVNNTFSRGVTTSEVDTRRLSQHAKTQMHKDAMDACEQAKRAPGRDSFVLVYKKLAKCGSYHEVANELGMSRGKLLKMAWTIKEVIMDGMRKTMMEADAIAIHQDGAKQRHAMLFTLVHKGMIVERGLLGVGRRGR